MHPHELRVLRRNNIPLLRSSCHTVSVCGFQTALWHRGKAPGGHKGSTETQWLPSPLGYLFMAKIIIRIILIDIVITIIKDNYSLI